MGGGMPTFHPLSKRPSTKWANSKTFHRFDFSLVYTLIFTQTKRSVEFTGPVQIIKIPNTRYLPFVFVVQANYTRFFGRHLYRKVLVNQFLKSPGIGWRLRPLERVRFVQGKIGFSRTTMISFDFSISPRNTTLSRPNPEQAILSVRDISRRDRTILWSLRIPTFGIHDNRTVFFFFLSLYYKNNKNVFFCNFIFVNNVCKQIFVNNL